MTLLKYNERYEVINAMARKFYACMEIIWFEAMTSIFILLLQMKAVQY